jgi:hypothetical protein
MAPRHNLDHDPAILHALDGLVAGVDHELLANGLLDRDLAPFTYSTGHGMNKDIHPHLSPQGRTTQSSGIDPPRQLVCTGNTGILRP